MKRPHKVEKAMEGFLPQRATLQRMLGIWEHRPCRREAGDVIFGSRHD
jgi:hypothetical protein